MIYCIIFSTDTETKNILVFVDTCYCDCYSSVLPISAETTIVWFTSPTPHLSTYLSNALFICLLVKQIADSFQVNCWLVNIISLNAVICTVIIKK